jgi:hypothetical protein
MDEGEAKNGKVDLVHHLCCTYGLPAMCTALFSFLIRDPFLVARTWIRFARSIDALQWCRSCPNSPNFACQSLILQRGLKFRNLILSGKGHRASAMLGSLSSTRLDNYDATIDRYIVMPAEFYKSAFGVKLGSLFWKCLINSTKEK